MAKCTLFWFRSDLRIGDNTGLSAAIDEAKSSGKQLKVLYIMSPVEWIELRHWGLAKVDYLLRTVDALQKDLQNYGIQLILRRIKDSTLPSLDDESFEDVDIENSNSTSTKTKAMIAYEKIAEEVISVCKEIDSDSVFSNKSYDLVSKDLDKTVDILLSKEGISHSSHHDECVVPVGEVKTQSGGPQRVFTPFKKCWASWIEKNNGHPKTHAGLIDTRSHIESVRGNLENESNLDTTASKMCSDLVQYMMSSPAYIKLRLDLVRDAFPAGEKAGIANLNKFVMNKSDKNSSTNKISTYDQDRNTLGGAHTSAPLAVGAISLRQCLQAAMDVNHPQGGLLHGQPGVVCWISELAWRDFYRHILFHYPHVARGRSYKPEYENLPWRAWPTSYRTNISNSQSKTKEDPLYVDAHSIGEETVENSAIHDSEVKFLTDKEREEEKEFKLWCLGETGIPVVDAAMRQLLSEGIVENRMRMVVASYLTKHLLIHWRRGERHFERHLIDFDYSSNNGGWQWSASTGTDSQPYFRIFNPTSQSEKFTLDGAYIRLHVPELANLSSEIIHEPHLKLPKKQLDALNYPRPIIENKEGRDRAIAMFSAVKKRTD